MKNLNIAVIFRGCVKIVYRIKELIPSVGVLLVLPVIRQLPDVFFACPV